jgi:hypothetical protein
MIVVGVGVDDEELARVQRRLPLFGFLADAPDLEDALDAIVAERGDRVLRAW